MAEIEGYQKVIDGARTVVENYRPHIVVDPEWPNMVGDLADNLACGTCASVQGHSKSGPFPYYWVIIGDRELRQ